MGGLLLAPNSELCRLLGGELSPESARLLAADVKGLVHLSATSCVSPFFRLSLLKNSHKSLPSKRT